MKSHQVAQSAPRRTASAGKADLSAKDRHWHGPPQAAWLDAGAIAALQRQAGNTAVADLLEPTESVQREAAAPSEATKAASPTHDKAVGAAGKLASAGKQHGGRTNGTFQDARDYVRTFFQRQKEIGALLVDMKDTGFRNFQIHSSEEYNKEDSLAAALFEAALAAAPGCSALLASYKGLAAGAKFSTDLADKLEKVLEKANAVIEKGEKVGKAAKAAGQIPEKASGESEARKLGDFQAEQITNLAELRVDNLVQRWTEEDLVMAALDAARNAPADDDLTSIVRGSLGPIPTANGLKSAMMQAAEGFEVHLYLHYYVDGGKIYNSVRVNQIGDEYNRAYNVGWPPGVEKRLKSLGRMPDPSKLPLRVYHFSSPGKML
jgi:hypothetical protein